MTWVIGVLVLLLVLWMVVSRSGARPLDELEQEELHRLRILVDDLKETAWDHRELDSALSTIIIDKIRTHERRRRRELGD
jgi:hypothetical protein